MMSADWVVLYRHPKTCSYEYVAHRRYKVIPDQQFNSVVDKIFADLFLKDSGRLAGKVPEDFITEFYELPNWPTGCERVSPRATITDAFARTVGDTYVSDTCRRYFEDQCYALAWKTQNLLLLLHPNPRSPSLRSNYLNVMHETNGDAARADREVVARAALKRILSLSERTPQAGAVYNYRPLSSSGPPVAVYHPAFANFQCAMSAAQDFSLQELNLAFNFVIECSAYLASSYERKEAMCAMQGAIKADILKAVVLTLTPSGKVTPQADGIVDSTLREITTFRAVRVIHKINNEIGEGGSDPIAQAERCYVQIYCSDQAQILRNVSPCPCILVGTAGPNITVSGAVFADRIISQPLTDYISIIPRLTESGKPPVEEAVYRVARLFRALKLALEELDDYYSQLVIPKPPWTSSMYTQFASYAYPSRARDATSAGQEPSYISPHFTTFSMPDGTEIALEYTGRMPGAHQDKAVFAALADTGSDTKTQVVVKFCHAYSREGHELLARSNPPLAPKLWFCDRVESVGMYVVVMDLVVDCNRPLSDAGRASLRRAVSLLHEHNLVFGDLRAPNALVTQDGRVLLIGFDWCGKAGEARYPIDLNTAPDMHWHPKVQPGGLIEKEHDNYLADWLTSRDRNQL